MFYRKNVSGKERVLRLVMGCLMILGGLLGLKATLLGLLIAGAGAMTILTGMFGYCPACAMIGRKTGK